MSKLENYKSQLRSLEKAPEKDLEDDYIISAVKDKFVVQFELAWKAMREALFSDGIAEDGLGTPRAVVKRAVIAWPELDEGLWLDMLKKRNMARHMYNEVLVRELVPAVIGEYIPEFQKLERLLSS